MVAQAARASRGDVGVENMEKRLSPLFEYLRMRYEQDSQNEDDSDVIHAVVSCGRQALEAACGGFHDAKALVFDAFFFAWVSHAPSVGVIPGDPFAARSSWRLSLKQFQAAVEELNLRHELRNKLRRVPDTVSRKIIALLDDSLLSSSDEVDARNEDSFRQAATEMDEETSPKSECAGPSSHDAEHDIEVVLETVQQATRDDLFTRAQLAGTTLMCSEQYQESRVARRSEATDSINAERELVAMLNRIGGDADATWKQDARAFALELVKLLLTSPEMTLSRLARVASTNASQKPFLLSAFSAQPGIIRMRLEPHEPPRMLMELAHLLHKPPAELKGFHSLKGLKALTEALCQPQDVLSDATDNGGRFGHRRLVVPSRSQLDHRHVLLFIVIPALSLTVDETDSEFEFWALRILQTLLTGFREEETGDIETPFACSPSGTRLLRASYPGSILLALASRIDSRSGNVAERTRELAARLLRCCVIALNSDNLHGDENLSTLVSLAHADAEAATRLTWHTRMIMEPLMLRVREIHLTPTQSPPSAPSLRPMDDVRMTAAAIADLILLCALQLLRGADVMDLIWGNRGADGHLKERIERIQNCLRSPIQLRGALLEACVTLLPRLTAREFDVVLRDVLPRLLSFIQGAPDGDEGSCKPIVMDFLTRVLLTQMLNSGRSRDMETLSRQLAITATMDGVLSATDGALHTDIEFLAVAFHNLRCISVTLSQMTTNSSTKTGDILLNAALELAGKLCNNVGMVSEVTQLFEACPDEKCKQHVLAVCNAKGAEDVHRSR
jgi:hypothetical protein